MYPVALRLEADTEAVEEATVPAVATALEEVTTAVEEEVEEVEEGEVAVATSMGLGVRMLSLINSVKVQYCWTGQLDALEHSARVLCVISVD